MFFIALIILICIFTYIFARKADWNKSDRRATVWLALFVSTLFLLPVGLFAPLAGCGEMQCVEEISLIELREMPDPGTWYVYTKNHTINSSAKHTYAYSTQDKYALEGEAYQESYELCGESVKIYESKECTKPILKKFERKGKLSIFSFALGYKETETVFFVPEGTVLKE